MSDNENYIKDYFKERVAAFPEYYKRTPLLPMDLYIVDQIPSGASVLDMCCGGGAMALALAKKGVMVTGVDYVPEMIERCKDLFAEDGCKGTFLAMDARHTRYKNAVFSHVTCTGNSLNCMENETARQVIREIARVLKPDGTIYLTILNPRSIRNLLGVVKGKIQQAPAGGAYYKSSYGLSPDGKKIPRGLSFHISLPKMERYLREAGLVHESMHWKSNRLLLMCRKSRVE